MSPSTGDRPRSDDGRKGAFGGAPRWRKRHPCPRRRKRAMRPGRGDGEEWARPITLRAEVRAAGPAVAPFVLVRACTAAPLKRDHAVGISRRGHVVCSPAGPRLEHRHAARTMPREHRTRPRYRTISRRVTLIDQFAALRSTVDTLAATMAANFRRLRPTRATTPVTASLRPAQSMGPSVTPCICKGGG